MMRTRLTILTVLSVALVALGCTEGGGEAGSAAQGPATTGATGGSTPSSAPSPDPSQALPSTTSPGTTSPGGPPTGQQIQVSGTVVAGVEPGCLLLDADQSEQYLLLGGDPSVIRPGTRVEVVGVLVDNVLSTCQQGRPLSVVSAKRA